MNNYKDEMIENKGREAKGVHKAKMFGWTKSSEAFG